MESAMLQVIVALGALAGRAGELKLPQAWPLISLLF